MNSTFDESAATYEERVQSSIAFAGAQHALFTRRKVDSLIAVIERHLGDARRAVALDIGAGVGGTDELLQDRVGTLVSCDPSPVSAAVATDRNLEVPFTIADATQLPFCDRAVDVAFAINVLHHVEPSNRDKLVSEMRRVVRRGGLVIVYEHNPHNPLTRLSVARCEFDEGVTLLSSKEIRNRFDRQGLELVERRYIIFTPFDRSWQHRLEEHLGLVALGAQHYVAARRQQ